jgi:hypothetical protein
LTNYVWRHKEFCPDVQCMSNIWEYQYKRCYATHNQPPDRALWCLGHWLHVTIPKIKELRVYPGSNELCVKICGSPVM